MISGNLVVFLVGAAMIGVPILLHLLMQQKPKRLKFPAIRFLQERRESNQRKLKLRHFLLLLLRCLILVALAAALAGPAVASNQFGAWLIFSGVLFSGAIVSVILFSVLFAMRPMNRPLVGALSTLLLAHVLGGSFLLVKNLREGDDISIGDSEAPVAAILVFDTSPRMGLQHQNTTRLDAAREIADWVLDELPGDSQVAVVESTTDAAFFSVDLAAARKRMETFDVRFRTSELSRSIESALRLAEESELPQKEIYLFTDLTQRSWSGGSTERINQLLAKAQNVGVYVIDVGVEAPSNLSIGDLRLNAESLTRNGQVKVQGNLTSRGESGTRTVEFHVEKPDRRRPVRRDGKTLVPEETWVRRETLTFSRDGSAPFRFELGGLDVGVHHGWVEIIGDDGMPSDDRRYFTVEVRGQWQTLVVAPAGVNPTNITQLLSPYAFRQSGRAMFDCRIIQQADLSTERFDDYSAVFLLDPEPISEAGWNLLHDYAMSGGGVFIFLGHNAEFEGAAHPSFNSEAAQQVLPGLLAEIWRGRDGELFINPQDDSHEILAPFRQFRSSVPWSSFPVHLHWGMRASSEQDTDAIRVVTRYSNRMPALVEKQVGEGRVLTMTTPYTDPSSPEGRRRWNDLPLGECWPTWLLIKQASEYLVQIRESRRNYAAGELVFLENDDERFPAEYRLFTPNPTEEPRRVRAAEGVVRLRSAEEPGNYRLKGDAGGVVLRGFSVNMDAKESDLRRIGKRDLDTILGDERYQLATSTDEIQREQGVMRSGQEFYGILIVLLVIFLTLEHLLANRFYGQRSPLPVTKSPSREVVTSP